MTWQDLVLGTGTIVFIVALIPMLFHREKPPIKSSVMTGLTLAAFSMTFATLGLIFASITDAITSGMWLTLAVQRARR